MDARTGADLMLTRRAFVQSVFAAAAVSPLVDIDRLLWVPGARSWFIPASPKPLHTLEGQAEAFLRELVRLRKGKAALTLGESPAMVGDVFGRVIAQDQLVVGMVPIEKGDTNPMARYITPAAAAIANSIPIGASSCYPLLGNYGEQIPAHIAIAHDPLAGLSVRAIRSIDHCGADVVRIDLLIGSPVSLGRIAPRDAPLSLGFHTHNVEHPCEVRHSPGGTLWSDAWDDDEDA